ncbi:MAG: glycosyltransferase family 2 protein [Clostridiales bacterium]|nr:glycosyltransferase family 2 protein [Candidatus Blautia equi]
MEKTPAVSIIIPAYNAEPYLEAAVKSVLAQTFSDWELLIIDDCSGDHTWDIMQKLSEWDSRIRLLQNPVNQGVAATRNRGVSLARAEWIAFLDADDLWESRKLEKQIALALSDPKIAFTFTGSAFIDAAGNPVSYQLKVPEKITRSKLLGQNVISCSSVMLKKDWIQKYPMPDNREIHEDFATWLAILKEVPYAYGINEPLLIYRRTASSKSGNKSHAARLNWNTYKVADVHGPERVISMFLYTVKGLIKYASIKMNRSAK